MAGKRNHFAVHLDGDPAPVVTQLVEELSDGEGFRQRFGLPVKCYLDHLAPPAVEIGRFDFVRLAYSLYDSRFWSSVEGCSGFFPGLPIDVHAI